jgi:nucleoside-diphosphate-sugar epimerase
VKALVTGGGGFVGTALVKRLRARGDDVTVLARGDYPILTQLGARALRGDVSNADDVTNAVRDQDVVFHVAAKAGVWGKAADYEKSNIEGTQRVIDACIALGVRALVDTSSPSVTFDGGDAVDANESLPYPRAHLYHYGRTKAESERRVLNANGTPHKSGNGMLWTTALRPHLVYGEGDPHILPRIVSRARSGRLAIIGEGTNKVDITHVDNAAHAHVLAGDVLLASSSPDVQPACAGKVYFISDDHPVVPWEWINRILGELGVPPVTRHVPLGVASTIGRVCELLWTALPLPGEPLMTRFLAAQLGTSHHYNLSAAKRDLGYAPIVDPEEALRRTLPWLKAELAAGRLG